MVAYTPAAVVLGAKFPGLACARYIADFGADVVVLEPTAQIGGMTTGGLGKTDIVGQPGTSKNTRWGRTLDYYKLIGASAPYNFVDGSEQINFASNEAVAALNTIFLGSPHVTIRTNARPKRVFMTETAAARKAAVVELENGDTYISEHFVDASYERDLARMAGVRSSSGRESGARYDERVQYPDKIGGLSRPGLNIAGSVLRSYKSVDARGDRYPHRTLPPPSYLPEGSASPRQQAYGWRPEFSNLSDRVPWSSLAPYLTGLGYRAADFAWVADMIANGGGAGAVFPLGYSLFPVSGAVEGGSGVYISNGGDLPGLLTSGWDDLTYDQRDARALEAFYLVAGAIYTAATSTDVPIGYRDAINEWGLPATSFGDAGSYIGAPHWPGAFYVRQAAGIIAQYVMTTSDMFDDGSGSNWRFDDSISVGGYTVDAHAYYAYPTPDGQTIEEGKLNYSGLKQYGIPLRALLPHRSQCANMPVLWGVGGSTLFRNSYRMEPTAAVCGQAIGMLIGLAWQMGVDIASVPFSMLKQRLLAAGAVLKI